LALGLVWKSGLKSGLKLSVLSMGGSVGGRAAMLGGRQDWLWGSVGRLRDAVLLRWRREVRCEVEESFGASGGACLTHAWRMQPLLAC